MHEILGGGAVGHAFFNLKIVNLIVEHQTWKTNYHYIEHIEQQVVCVWGGGGGANLNNFIKGVQTLRKFRF